MTGNKVTTALLTKTWLSVHDTLNAPIIQEIRNSSHNIMHIIVRQNKQSWCSYLNEDKSEIHL